MRVELEFRRMLDLAVFCVIVALRVLECVVPVWCYGMPFKAWPVSVFERVWQAVVYIDFLAWVCAVVVVLLLF